MLRKQTLNRPWFLVISSALMSLGLAVLQIGEALCRIAFLSFTRL